MSKVPGPKKAPVLNARRLAVVEKAFRRFDQDGSGVVDIADLAARYDVARHPSVLSGQLSQTMVKEMFLNQFEAAQSRDGRVTWQEFVEYYTKLASEIDRGREIDKDGYFELVVTRAWRLDEEERALMPSTQLRVASLDMPEGLLASIPMDLVWPTAEGFVGFKGVVKHVFARRILPERLRGYISQEEDSTFNKVKFLPLSPSLMPNFDLVWQSAGGNYEGLQGVISSKVDLAGAPEELRAAVTTQAKSTQLGVSYLPVAETFNPVYKKSSQSIGVGAVDAAKATCTMKAAYYAGNGCGQVYVGRVGKFTDQFLGGPYSNSSLNVSSKSVRSTFT